MEEKSSKVPQDGPLGRIRPRSKKFRNRIYKRRKFRGDPFSNKESYDIKAPYAMFAKRQIGKTFANKTQGTKLSRDFLIGRVLEVSMGDLSAKGEDEAFRKIKLKVEEVSGTHCLTNFHGMDLTTDKRRSLVRKWHTLIEAHADVKTTDGYLLRLFCVGSTKRRLNQTSKTSYALTSQVRRIRHKMVDIMTQQAALCDLQTLVQHKLLHEAIGREIDKATQGIYPLQNVMICKVKMLRAPKMDITKLLSLHGAGVVTRDMGRELERPQEEEQAAAPAS